MSRQAYYQGGKRREARREREEQALGLVRNERGIQPRLGTRKIYDMYREALRCLRIGRDKLFALLRRAGLLVRPRRRRTVTTDASHGRPVCANLLKGEADPTGPNQVWAADITYVPTRQGFCYAALITDCYSRKIVGYDLSHSLSVNGSVRALRAALKAHTPRNRFIHHSDRGVQYCAADYQRLARAAGARLSMTAGGDPYANALAERVNGTLKVEYGLEDTFEGYEAARKALREAVQPYNERRPHLALGYKTPAQVHNGTPPTWAT